MRIVFLLIPLLTAALAVAGCSALRESASAYEKAAAKNEAGQLITPSAASDDQVASAPDAPTTATTKVLNIEKAAKKLPKGLGGDIANSAHYGDPIPPK